MARRGKEGADPLEGVDVEEWLREMPEWKLRVLERLARGEKLKTMDAVRIAGKPYATVIKWLQRLEKRGVVVSKTIGFQRRRTWTMPENVRKRLLEALKRVEGREGKGSP